MKIGLYFGSFNPLHIGHLIIANHILNEITINKVWFVVSPQNPFKQSNTLLNGYERLHLVNKAVADDPRIKAIDIEFQLPKPSYTVNTLTYLKEKYPQHEFTILMGSDSFQNFSKWKNFEVIRDNYEIFIYIRPGFAIENTFNARITVLTAPLLDISATYIRELVQNNKSIKYLVPESIEEEIQNNIFYKSKKISQ
jgi:nicotinate-nucleotide adenylyltransferase